MNDMYRYKYVGPVCEFDRVVQNKWEGETTAVSEKKAKSNLIFQWKKQNNRLPNTRVSLPGKLEVIGGTNT